MVLKYTPQLHFYLDETVERGTKIMEIMRQIDETVPPADDAANDGPMDDEEPVGNTEELIRLEEAEDATDAPDARPRREAMEADLTKPRGRRAEDAARLKREGRDHDRE